MAEPKYDRSKSTIRGDLIAGLSPDQMLIDELSGLDEDLEDARDDRSWQAVAAFRRQRLAAYAELRDLKARESASDPLADLADDELAAKLSEFMAVIPEPVLEELQAIIDGRLGGTIRVLLGGK